MVGGSGRWLWEVYRRLPREDVLVVAGRDPRQEAFDRSHDLGILREDLSPPSWGLLDRRSLAMHGRLLARLGRLIRSEGVSVVHAGKCLPEGLTSLGLKLTRGIPYLCYVHGEEMNLASTSRELTWLTRRVLDGADVLIANSANTRRILEEDWGVPGRKVAVIHPGVDTSRFTPAPRDPKLRASLGWGERPVLLTVGRLQKRKGQDRMIEAMPAILARVPDVLYAIVGDGEERPGLEAMVARLGLGDHVRFLGESDDEALVAAYQQCDLFALPNRRVGHDIEGFGMVLIEAQACGKPVLAGNSGGTPETLSDPDTGRVVDADDPEGLAEVVVGLLSDRDRLDRMGEAARDRAVDHFDWGVVGREAERLFRAHRAPDEAAGAPSLGKRILKRVANGLAGLAVLPAVILYRVGVMVVGADRAFPGWSQAFALLPGQTGVYLRRAFYRSSLARCGEDASVGFGTTFSSPAAEIGRGVYIGVQCTIGDVTLGDDVLISSHVSILNGGRQHGIERLDVPIRDQPGEWPRVAIGRDSWIGERSIVMTDVGEQCVVGAGSVVSRPLEDRSIAVGVPARVVRKREDHGPGTSTGR